MSDTLMAHLQRQVQLRPDKTAIIAVMGGKVQKLSYSQLYEQARRVAAWLRHQGFQPGERGAIVLENRVEWPLCYFGLLLAGGTAVPVDVQTRPEHLSYILEQTGATIVFASAQAPLPTIAAAPSLHQLIIVGEPPPCAAQAIPFDRLLATPPLDTPWEGAATAVASIIYTSGTTGPPKGVMLTHKNFVANYEGIAALQAVTPEDNFLAILPLFHAFPFTATLLLPLFTGATVTFLDTLKAEPVLRCLKEQRVTILPVTPQVLQHFYRGMAARLEALPLGLGRLLPRVLELARRWHEAGGPDCASFLTNPFRQALGDQFRFFVSGGAKLPEDLAENLTRLGFTVLEGYGLTETAPVVSINPPDAPRLGSAGKPLVNVQVRIDQPDERGIGEIFIRGENVMAGYFHNEEATRTVFQDGWFKSGDLGRLDADGYLYVQGRLKDIIVLSSGKNISAEEIAQHYLQAPAIQEIFILPDPRQEKLVAVIYPNFAYFRQTGETDIHSRVKWYLDYYSQQLEPYKRVRDFVLTNQELPKTRLGKIRMQEAAKIYQKRVGKVYQAKKSALESDLSAVGLEVVRLLLAKSGLPVIALEDHLELDLGLDSLALVELAAALEERFQVAIPDTGFAEVFTVRELINLVESRQPHGPVSLPSMQRSWRDILQEEPPEALRRRLELGSPLAARLFTLTCSVVFGLLARAFFRLRGRGQEQLPAGPALICPNHTSFLDGFLIFLVTPQAQRQNLFFLGSTYYFDLPLIRPLVKALRVIPVDSARHLVEAMQASAYVLRHGKLLCVFPEGARSITGELREIKKGVVILAKELAVPIVPAYIRGSYEAWSPLATWPKPHPISVTFGPPQRYEQLVAVGSRLRPAAGEEEAATLGLRQAIEALAPISPQ